MASAEALLPVGQTEDASSPVSVDVSITRLKASSWFMHHSRVFFPLYIPPPGYFFFKNWPGRERGGSSFGFRHSPPPTCLQTGKGPRVASASADEPSSYKINRGVREQALIHRLISPSCLAC